MNTCTDITPSSISCPLLISFPVSFSSVAEEVVTFSGITSFSNPAGKSFTVVSIGYYYQ